MDVVNVDNAYTFNPDSAHTVTITGLLRDEPTATALTTHPKVQRKLRLCPRSNADIIDHGLNVGVGPQGLPQRVSLSVSPNPNPTKKSRVSWALPRQED